MSVYLCGPINGCTDDECKNWREYTKRHLPKTTDPMSRDYRGREEECAAEIVELDKQDIDNCHTLLVMYDKPSVGTSMEVLYAWERGKTIIVCHDQGARISPWLRYHATGFFTSLDQAITHILGGGEHVSRCAGVVRG